MAYKSHSTTITVFASLVALILPVASALAEPAQQDRTNTGGPINTELAKKCRDLAIKAHPTERAGTTPYAQAQREYFQDCIAKRGNVPE
jgi:hypothetical protein